MTHGVTETPVYSDDRIRKVLRVEFHCIACGLTWTDPKGRSGDTVVRDHWRECRP